MWPRWSPPCPLRRFVPRPPEPHTRSRMAIVRLRSADLKQALETGALSLHYQPQVVIATGKLAGVEAFVRWPHPAYGMIGPSDIIPLVDQAGMHVEFYRWVIGAICRQASHLRNIGVVVQ